MPPVDGPSRDDERGERLAQLDRRGLARALTRIERGDTVCDATAVLGDSSCHIVGVTGPPGVGKSTLVAALTTQLRAAGRLVVVLAVDPSSPVTGGALLGDRIRMSAHAHDDGVFIRSLANRGQLGGLSAAIPAAIRAAVAHGAETVLVETVGVGQADVDIAALADTTVVVSGPVAGDAIQAGKAGLLEVADVLVVNKSDHAGAQQAARDLREMLRLRSHASSDWRVPVVTTRADTGEGVAELAQHVRDHDDQLRRAGALGPARAVRTRVELRAIAMQRLSAVVQARLTEDPGGLVADVLEGRLSPVSAAERLFEDVLRAAAGGAAYARTPPGTSPSRAPGGAW